MKNIYIPPGWELVKIGEIIPKGSYYYGDEYDQSGSIDIKDWKLDKLHLIYMIENKEYILANLPPGYVYIKPGDNMPEISYYINFYKTKKCKDINNWYKYHRISPNEKRSKDIGCIFIKAIPAEKKPAPPKLTCKPITDFKIGDIFIYGTLGSVIVPDTYKENTTYSIAGLNGLKRYSNAQNLTKQEMLDYLNDCKQIYITNINDKINKTIEAGLKMVE
jgi:hypothetical protein